MKRTSVFQSKLVFPFLFSCLFLTIFPGFLKTADGRLKPLSDAHQGVKSYGNLKCAGCHAERARNRHTARSGVTCRQCHGGEPIANLLYYHSRMNPVRRHAYVCAKCHQGATASFADYVVHSPNPASAEARRDFPALFYTFWIMIGIAVGTFAVFLPHTFLWGIREIFTSKEKKQ